MIFRSSFIFIILVINISASAQKLDQEIIFQPIPPKTYGDPSFELSATATSGLSITFSSSNTQIATIAGNIVTIRAAGEAIITAVQNGNDDYNPALQVQQVLVVDKASQSITFNPLPPYVYGTGPFNLIANSTSGLTVSFESSDNSIAVASGNIIHIRGAGVCTITAKQSGNNNYQPATEVVQEVIVNKADQIIFFNPIPSKTFGDPPFQLTAGVSSFLEPVFRSSDPSIVSIEGNEASIVGAGTVDIIASQPGDQNHNPAIEVVRTIVIKKASQQIIFEPIEIKTYGDPPFMLQATADSGLPLVYSIEFDSLAIIDGNTVTIVGAGKTRIYAYQDGNQNYLPQVIQRDLIINKANQSITFEALLPKKFGDPSFSISALASSGLPVLFSSSKKTIATVSNNVITILAAGTAPIVASQPGNANYHAATPVVQPLVISPLGNTYPLIGSTRNGGLGRGTVFSVNTDGSDHIIRKSFLPGAFNAPQNGLIIGSDGKLYGTILAGGNPSNGIVYSIRPDGSDYKVLHNFQFTDGNWPYGKLLEASNGYLYGMTYSGGANHAGVIFRLKKDGTDFTLLYEFPGNGVNGFHPLGGLIQALDGDLYGMTMEGGNSHGNLFKIKLDGTGFTNLMNFNATTTGSYPRGDLLQGPDQFLYGLTYRGGSANMGVLFKVKTDGTGYTKLIEFNGLSNGSYPGTRLLLANNGKLYGVTQFGGTNDLGVLFSVNTNGSNFLKLIEFDGSVRGSQGLGGLIQASDGHIYGMTNQGGSANMGLVFRVAPNGTGFTKIADFNGQNGANPAFGSLVEFQAGMFVGATSKGGPSDTGVIFSLSSSGIFNWLKIFPQDEGLIESLIPDPSGNNLFGVTSIGGSSGNGGIFKTDGTGSNYSSIHSITGNSTFVGNVYPMSDNSIWGIGREGVVAFTYHIFKMNNDGSGFQRIIEFTNSLSQGVRPMNLIEAPDGWVYGTTHTGGQSNNGILFKMKLDGTGFTKLVDIPGGLQGSRPTANLIIHPNGNLYGLTLDAVFEYDKNGNYKAIHRFATETGTGPRKLIILNNGSLGILAASGGSQNNGCILSISTDGGDYEKLVDFSPSAGNTPVDLIQTVDGLLIGSMERGGQFGEGFLYQTLIDGSSFSKIIEFKGTDGSYPNSLHFRKVETIIRFEPIAPKTFNNQPIILEATSNTGLPITFTSSNPDIVSVNGNIATIHRAGETILKASLQGNTNYLPAETQQILSIGKAEQNIIFEVLADRLFGNTPFELTGVSTAGLPVYFESTSNNIALEGNLVSPLHPGAVTIHAIQPGNENYHSAKTTQSFCLLPLKPGVTKSGTNDIPILISSYESGNQWFRNETPIPGANEKTLTVREDGTFSV